MNRRSRRLPVKTYVCSKVNLYILILSPSSSAATIAFGSTISAEYGTGSADHLTVSELQLAGVAETVSRAHLVSEAHTVLPAVRQSLSPCLMPVPVHHFLSGFHRPQSLERDWGRPLKSGSEDWRRATSIRLYPAFQISYMGYSHYIPIKGVC